MSLLIVLIVWMKYSFINVHLCSSVFVFSCTALNCKLLYILHKIYIILWNYMIAVID